MLSHLVAVSWEKHSISAVSQHLGASPDVQDLGSEREAQSGSGRLGSLIEGGKSETLCHRWGIGDC